MRKQVHSPLFVRLLITGLYISGLVGCERGESCLSNAEGRAKFSLLKTPVTEKTAAGSISIRRGTFQSYDPESVSAATADKACLIASRIFNSAEFYNELVKLDFRYSNHCKKCGQNENDRSERIAGKEVLDNIFKHPSVTINLFMNRGRCHGALGSTCPGYDRITSNHQAIQCDMSNLNFAYAYAVHLCHEYMHIIGYCHTDHRDDVAEKVGWIAYYIVTAWPESLGTN